MLTFGLPRGIRHCDGLTRREVMRVGAIGLGGLSLLHLLGARSIGRVRVNAPGPPRPVGHYPLPLRRALSA